MNSPFRNALRGITPPKAREAFRDHVRQEFLGSAYQPRRGYRTLWLTGVAAATLALVFYVWNPSQPSPSQWHMVSTGGSTVSGTIHNPGPGLLKVEIENSVRWHLLPGTTVRLSPPELGQPLRVFVQEGTALATTGPDFPSAGLLVNSEFLNISVTGTTFGVLAGADSTCICVLEGNISVDSASPETIPPATIFTRYATSTHRSALQPSHRKLLGEIAQIY